MKPASGLIIRSSAIHAAGCYTLRTIRRGERVCEYDGPRFTKAVADQRYKDRFVTYLFSLGAKGTVIDGFGTAMFLNHSCSPNCETEEDAGRIFIRALRRIEAGEELTYEYNLHDSDEDDCACACGAAECRGTMLSDEELKRRERKARSAKKAPVRKRRATISEEA